MVHYRRSLAVPMPLDQVFAYLSRFSSAAEWDPGVASAQMLTSEPVRLGSVFALDAVFMRKTVPLRYEITEFEPPSRVVLSAENASVRSTDEITFRSDPASGGTVVRYDASLALKGLARVAAPAFALAFRRIGNRASEGLLAALTPAASGAPGGPG
jgi:dehydrogenase/reductase SDR family member 12